MTPIWIEGVLDARHGRIVAFVPSRDEVVAVVVWDDGEISAEDLQLVKRYDPEPITFGQQTFEGAEPA